MPRKVFVNHTNHPSYGWDEAQKHAAMSYGEIVDVPFPSIAPEAGEEEVRSLAERNAGKILELKPEVVLCQGEFTYTYAMVDLLKKHGVLALAASSERVVEEVQRNGMTQKVSLFQFVRFRSY